MKRWDFEQDEAGRNVIRHNALPRFRAYWTSGTAKEAAPLEVYWHEEGSNEDDGLYLYGLHWIDTPPDAKAWERLMKEATKAIDTWISNRF